MIWRNHRLRLRRPSSEIKEINEQILAIVKRAGKEPTLQTKIRDRVIRLVIKHSHYCTIDEGALQGNRGSATGWGAEWMLREDNVLKAAITRRLDSKLLSRVSMNTSSIKEGNSLECLDDIFDSIEMLRSKAILNSTPS